MIHPKRPEGKRFPKEKDMNGYILALDQGTTSSRAILFDTSGNAVVKAQYPLKQIYPRPGAGLIQGDTA